MKQPERIRGRTASRMAAVQALFQNDQTQDKFESIKEQFVLHRFGNPELDEALIPNVDVPLFTYVFRLAVQERDRIDAALAGVMPPGWTLPRIDPVLRALLRAGGAELADPKGAPVKVIINEYIDIARAFFTGSEPGLVNAILDRLSKTLRDTPPGV